LVLYATSYYDDAVTVFLKDASDAWSLAAEIRNGESGIAAMESPRDIALAPDGLAAAVVSSASDSLSLFTRAPATGYLEVSAEAVDGDGWTEGTDGARSVAYSPDGGFLAVAASNSDAVALYRREMP
jgi:6-phosphogluconolactonase (cycloisomerase 2 family)